MSSYLILFPCFILDFPETKQSFNINSKAFQEPNIFYITYIPTIVLHVCSAKLVKAYNPLYTIFFPPSLIPKNEKLQFMT